MHMPKPTAPLGMAELAVLLPMHLCLDVEGNILSCGPTLRKLVGPASQFQALFELARLLPGEDPIARLTRSARGGDRVFLRMIGSNLPPLRGHAVALDRGAVLLNLGFGTGLIEAIQKHHLTDADFAPNDLAMELLFLHEANGAIMGELARHNQRLEEAREAAEMQAFTDPLTGLFNRRGFDLALDVAARAVSRGDPADMFSIAHLDLDWFKQVNDRFGHAAGDRVLCRIGEILTEETRRRDTVARIGGDEFVILFQGLTDPDALLGIGNRIIRRIEEPIIFETSQCRVSASIGVARSLDYPILEVEQLLGDADLALYQGKRTGKGRICLFEPGHSTSQPQSYGTHSENRAAI